MTFSFYCVTWECGLNHIKVPETLKPLKRGDFVMFDLDKKGWSVDKQIKYKVTKAFLVFECDEPSYTFLLKKMKKK